MPTGMMMVLLYMATLMGRAEPAVATTNSSKPSRRGKLSDEHRLFRYLMQGYERSIRPLYNSSEVVTVALGITLVQIADFDERNQVLATIVWLDQEWVDQKMQWEPERFGGLTKIRLPCNLLWLPDIVLYNSVDDHIRGYMQSLAMVNHTGVVFWPPIVKMRSSCKIDIKWFPFDSQVCFLKLGSWAYDGYQVDVTNRSLEVDTSNFITSGEWDVIATRVIRNVKWYPCCPEPFPDMMFYMHLQRRHLYYMMNIILPCMMMSLLTMTTFALPAESGEKITLGLTVMLSFSVFMLLIAETMPPTSESAPLASVYLTIIMGLSAASVMMSVLVLNVHTRGKTLKPPPKIVITLCRYLAVILLYKIEASVAAADVELEKLQEQKRISCACQLQRARPTLNGAPLPQLGNAKVQVQVQKVRTAKSSRSRWRRLHRKVEFNDSAKLIQSNQCTSTAPTTDTTPKDLAPNGLVYANMNMNMNQMQSPNPDTEERQSPVRNISRAKKASINSSNFSLDISAETRERARLNSLANQANSEAIAKRMASPLRPSSTDCDSDNAPIWQPRNGFVMSNSQGYPQRRRLSSKCGRCDYLLDMSAESETRFGNGPECDFGIYGTQSELLGLGTGHNRHFVLHRENTVMQWQQVSIILDRLLLAIFVGATLLVSLSMLVIVPQTRSVYSDTIMADVIERDRLELHENNMRALAMQSDSNLTST